MAFAVIQLKVNHSKGVIHLLVYQSDYFIRAQNVKEINVDFVFFLNVIV